MGVAAAYHHRVSLAGKTDVVGVAAVAAEQQRILAARNGLADSKFFSCQSFRRFVLSLAAGGNMQIHRGSISQRIIMMPVT